MEIKATREMNAALTALTALANEHRLGIFRLLVQKGATGMNAGAIATHLDLLPNTTSNHLKHLVAAGLLTRQRQGRMIRYVADFNGVRALLSYLLQDCCGGNARECAPILDAIAPLSATP